MKDYPAKTSIHHRMHHVLFFGNLFVFISGFAFFMNYPIAGHYGLEQLCMLVYFAISCFALFVYFTHSINKYTIRQSILITIIHFTDPSSRKRTVGNGFALALKEKNHV
jgi:hypothetical protein